MFNVAKKTFFQKFKDERSAESPFKNTPSQTWKEEKVHTDVCGNQIVLCITTLRPKNGSPIEVEFVDENNSSSATGRTDDGADLWIVSSGSADYAVLSGFSKMKTISLVTLQVPLKEGSDAFKFTSSQSWTASRTVPEPSAGAFVLRNIEYLVADADLVVQDLDIGLLALRRLGVDIKTLLENRRDLLDKTDCSSFSINNHHGRVGRLIIASLNLIKMETRNNGE